MATITGDDRANTLAGTGGADTIKARGGDDRLAGLAGGDGLYGEAGNDVLDGGAGEDLLDGGTGRDIATYASLGSPIEAEIDDENPDFSYVASAAGGRDGLVSIEGIVGTPFGDSVRGGSGTADLIRGGAGDDYLVGGYFSRASDTIYGGAGNDIIRSGEETLRQSGGAAPGTGDRFYGGGGNDRIFGVDGDDRLFGDAGDDVLTGGPDRDVLTGGAGRDTFSYHNIVPDPQDQIGDDFGPDLVADFRRGEDEILFTTSDTYTPESEWLRGFAGLDSNRNGRLDDGDRYVEVERVSFGGATKVSTVIDASAYPGGATAEDTLTVFGVTGLTAADFSDRDSPFS